MILLLASILPIIIIYSDGLETTTAKKNNILIAVLVPLCMLIIGFFFLMLQLCDEGCGKYTCSVGLGNLCLLITILAVSIPTGCIYGMSFKEIPNSCATLQECASYCSGIARVYQANLTDVKSVKLMIFHFEHIECGTCSCLCPSDHIHKNESRYNDTLDVVNDNASHNSSVSNLYKDQFMPINISNSENDHISINLPALEENNDWPNASSSSDNDPIFNNRSGVGKDTSTSTSKYNNKSRNENYVQRLFADTTNVPMDNSLVNQAMPSTAVQLITKSSKVSFTCNPLEEVHFGLSASTKLAIGVLSGLAITLLYFGVGLCFSNNKHCIFAGISIGYTVISLLICTLPVLIVYGSEAASAKRNNLLVATLVPLIMTIITFSVALWIPQMGSRTAFKNRWGYGKKYWTISVIVTVSVATTVSIPVGLEFGLRFASSPQSCVMKDECNQKAGVSMPTMIVIGTLMGLLVAVIIGWTIWNFKDLAKRWVSQRNRSLGYVPRPEIISVENRINSITCDTNIGNEQERYGSNYSVNMHFSELETILAEARQQGQTSSAHTAQRGQCVVCMDSDSDMVMKPCNHLCMCANCWITYKRDTDIKCPMCREKLNMNDIEKIFI